jgi:hypothetical protein
VQVTATKAEIQLPPITAQGCAIGLEGKTNNKNALAPIEATIHGDALPKLASNKPRPIMASKPNTTPKTDLNRSNQETELASGKKIAINLLKKYFKVVQKEASFECTKTGATWPIVCKFLYILMIQKD